MRSIFAVLCMAAFCGAPPHEAAAAQQIQQRPIVILSVEGGGVRGLIPALLLQEMEQQLGKPLSDYVDLFAGTSVGSIIITLLNLKDFWGNPRYNTADLVRIFFRLGPTIFPRNLRNKSALWGLTRPRYSKKPVEKALNEFFGEMALKDCRRPVVITSVDLEKNELYTFQCSTPDSKKCGIKLKDAVRASTAAPTYFHLHEFVDPVKQEKLRLADGGIAAMTPDLLALHQARKLFPRRRYLLISLSTGRSYDKRELSTKGAFAGSIPKLLDPLIKGTLKTQIEIAKKALASEPDVQYVRLDVDIKNCSSKLDETSEQNMKCLEKRAQEMRRKPAFKALVERLKESGTVTRAG